ncbi:hypothetical protein N9Y42_08225, partial [Mariniblastus sp.]|nr:hypothetical protein [Mariniblastus sp.]
RTALLTDTEHAKNNPTLVGDDDAPWFTWRALPLIILFIPFGLLFGVHVAGVALLLRRWVKLPYLVSMVTLYILMTIPLWILNPTGQILFPAIATTVVLLATIAPISLGGRDEMLNGSNIENSAPAHIMLLIIYMALPAVDAAMQKNAG